MLVDCQGNNYSLLVDDMNWLFVAVLIAAVLNTARLFVSVRWWLRRMRGRTE